MQVPERSKGLVLGTSVFARAGSNPVLHKLNHMCVESEVTFPIVHHSTMVAYEISYG